VAVLVAGLAMLLLLLLFSPTLLFQVSLFLLELISPVFPSQTVFSPPKSLDFYLFLQNEAVAILFIFSSFTQVHPWQDWREC